jgi:hypothetical protein
VLVDEGRPPVLIALLIAVAAVLVALVLVLSFRDRGRDRSSREVPQRDDWDIAGSNGPSPLRHNQIGPF